MSDGEFRALERELHASGRMDEFILEAMGSMDVSSLFRIHEASKRTLLERASIQDVAAGRALGEGMTGRGFALIEFSDLYGEECSLQKSSLATEDAVWLGVDEVNPKVFAPRGTSVSMTLKYQNGDSGWADVELNVEGANSSVLQSGRMHLSQERAKALLPWLQTFAETGSLTQPTEDSNE